MSKKSKSLERSTALSIALECGNPITGLVGYVPFKGCSCRRDDYDAEEAEVYIKVKVLGFSTGEGGCGVAVEVEPFSGVGKFAIIPCDWLDKPGDIEHLKEKQRRERLAHEDWKEITGPPFVRNRKANLLAYVEQQLDAKQKADFFGQVEEMKGSPDLKGISDQDTKWLAAVVCFIVHGVERKVSRDDYRYSN